MDILNKLIEQKDLGVAILMLAAMAILIKIFLNFIKEESKLSRDTHKEISKNSMLVLKEATTAITNLHSGNQLSHSRLEDANKHILSHVIETNKKVTEMHYQIKNK